MARTDDILERFEVRISRIEVQKVFSGLAEKWFPHDKYRNNTTFERLVLKYSEAEKHIINLEEKVKQLAEDLISLDKEKKEGEKSFLIERAEYLKLLSKAVNLEKDRQEFLKQATDALKFQTNTTR